MGEIAYKITNPDELSILKLTVTDEMLTAHISDGRIISIPVAWFSRLRNGTLEQLKNFEISPSGYGIHWPDMDEDVSIRAFLGV